MFPGNKRMVTGGGGMALATTTLKYALGPYVNVHLIWRSTLWRLQNQQIAMNSSKTNRQHAHHVTDIPVHVDHDCYSNSMYLQIVNNIS